MVIIYAYKKPTCLSDIAKPAIDWSYIETSINHSLASHEVFINVSLI